MAISAYGLINRDWAVDESTPSSNLWSEDTELVIQPLQVGDVTTTLPASLDSPAPGHAIFFGSDSLPDPTIPGGRHLPTSLANSPAMFEDTELDGHEEVGQDGVSHNGDSLSTEDEFFALGGLSGSRAERQKMKRFRCGL
jgi:hypothetical protein